MCELECAVLSEFEGGCKCQRWRGKGEGTGACGSAHAHLQMAMARAIEEKRNCSLIAV